MGNRIQEKGKEVRDCLMVINDLEVNVVVLVDQMWKLQELVGIEVAAEFLAADTKDQLTILIERGLI